MLRDMEELLNKVYDEEIKDYLNEALKCYMGGSYRACTIMSVIAGIYDVHKKVKALASSSPEFKKVDDEVEKRKRELEPYEKYLIEQCATKEIDMLNNNELKELQRCLDTRNDCAHPSDFICSPEKARDIYSSIIDILASKPVLFGCKHMKNIIEEMEERTFFPVNDALKIKVIVEHKLSRFQKRAIAPLFKLICTTIKNPNSKIQKYNAIRFLALATEYVVDEYESFISEFIDKDQYEGDLLCLLESNINILEYISDIRIEKIISKLDTFLNTSEINSISTWVSIILSKRLQEDKYIEDISKWITNFTLVNTNSHCKTDVRYRIVKTILEDKRLTERFKKMIKQNYSCKKFTLEDFKERYLRDILILLNDKDLYQRWLEIIITNVSSHNFNKENDAIYNLQSIDKDLWINSVTKESKICLVKKILCAGTRNEYNSYSCNELIYTMYSHYPELIKLFLENIFSNKESDNLKIYLTDRYVDIVSMYIVKNEEVTEVIIEKLKKLQNDNVDVKSIIGSLKNEIQNMSDGEKKKLLLIKFMD